MQRMKRSEEAGWALFEAVMLGLIVLAAAAVIGVFARTAILEEYSAARMDAALLARGQFSAMEAALDRGIPPTAGVSEISANNVLYTVQTEVVRQGDFHDVHLLVSWRIFGRAEAADFVRRMKEHVRTQGNL